MDGFSPQEVLKSLNNGNTTSPDQVANHIKTAGIHGYQLYLGILFYIVLFAVCLGLLLLIIGFALDNKGLKKWGVGAIFAPMASFGGSFFIPVALSWIHHFFSSSIFK